MLARRAEEVRPDDQGRPAQPAAGLGTAGLVAGLLTAFLDLVDLLPASFQVGEGVLNGLTTVNSST